MIRDTEFFTTAELAEKLKMNVQVLTRKVQAGEIEAYKIGKEWRIPEQAVANWLESNSNQRNETMRPGTQSRATMTAETVDRPASGRSNRKHLLEYILAQFEPQRRYSEQEVNGIISRHDPDFGKVRRQFVDERMLERVNGHYRRRLDYKLIG
jgi:excisionase family DNA binding protein